MAVQYLPIIKTLAPYITQIAAIAIPAFTSKKDTAKLETSESISIITKQIEELQSAASQNAQSVQVLAENLQQAIKNIDITAQQASKKISTYKAIIIISLLLSVTSLATCLYIISQ